MTGEPVITTSITNNAFKDEHPQVSGDKVVWSGAGGTITIINVGNKALSHLDGLGVQK